MNIKDMPFLRPVLKLQVPIQPQNYEIIQQQMIIHSEDVLITGIYLIKPFGEDLYMVLCFRQDEKDIDILDYTEYTNNPKKAEIFYKKMIQKITKDLGSKEVCDALKYHFGRRICTNCGAECIGMEGAAEHVMCCPGRKNDR